MQNTLKLKPKQLQLLEKLRNERTKLTEMLNDANQREADLLTIIFEAGGITGVISGADLVGDTLVYRIEEAKTPVKEKKKQVKKQEEKLN